MATYLSEAGPPSYQLGQASVGTLSSAQSAHQSLEKAAVKSLATDDKEKFSYTSTIEDFPEGGLRAWLCVFGASIVMFLTYGMMQAFGVFQDYYAKHLLRNHSPSEISWIGSVQTFLLFGLGVITGRCFDNGYFFHTIIPGSLIYTFSLFMLSLCQPGRYYQFFLSQGVGLGLGMGMLAVPSASIASHYFRTNQARANGIVFAGLLPIGTSLGGVVWPIILNRMINGPLGFSLSIR
ncbi:hypothetical protein PHLCEN_2v12201 [Hermanssonia centrifuga]|uniref:Major facilitator superfamily (MFS) profile domain-containing protein n=1 Tax=Hermanssonia centrifuga TaxID=98765 RepID=A0A2R6NI68_9APHY|nr:hypothetical protein PHLCEN_2v12201 [Hermanssonia centrifuga]